MDPENVTTSYAATVRFGLAFVPLFLVFFSLYFDTYPSLFFICSTLDVAVFCLIIVPFRALLASPPLYYASYPIPPVV